VITAVTLLPRADGHQGRGPTRRHAPGPCDGPGGRKVPRVAPPHHVHNVHRVVAVIGDQQQGAGTAAAAAATGGGGGRGEGQVA
jgi:hypothetical protein